MIVYKKILMMILIIALLSGCGSGDTKKQEQKPAKQSNVNTSVDNVNKNSTDVNNQNEKAVYTGENITESNYRNIPFMAIVENMKAARPQSGLSDADIVFETMAEGGIPRFMALFQSKQSDKIGPIRSDRPYFNELSESYDLPFAHCGGYQAALDEISRKHLMSLNEMYNGDYFWRDKTRKAPHNLFTSSVRLYKLIEKKNYIEAPKFDLEFDSSYWKDVKDKADVITLKFSGYYTTTYTYKNGRYMKTMDGRAVPDKNNGEQLSARNVVVQITSMAPIPGDPKERINIRLTGSGTGYVFSNGGFKKIKWGKDSKNSEIKLTDDSGMPVKLSAGNTWWSIMDKKGRVTIK